MSSKRKYGCYWELFSRKVQRRISFFSDLEFKHYLLVEFDPAIVSFVERPQLHGTDLSADMLVCFRHENLEIRQITYIRTLRQRRVAALMNEQIKWCRLNKVSHALLTEQENRANRIWLANCRFMHAQVSLYQVDAHFRDLALATLSGGQPKYLRDLYNRISKRDEGLLVTAGLKLSLMAVDLWEQFNLSPTKRPPKFSKFQIPMQYFCKTVEYILRVFGLRCDSKAILTKE